MKKAVGIFTALCLVIAMSACTGGGGSVTNKSSSKNSPSESSTSEKATDSSAEKNTELSYEDKYNQYIKLACTRIMILKRNISAMTVHI